MYLTEFQISNIIKDANNPEYLNDKIMHIGRHYYSIIKVSKIHNLILVEGNDKTGFQHINKRHCYYQSRYYWDQRGKLGSGSKFSSKTFGYWDYLKIADDIYDPKNLIVENKETNYDLYKAKLRIDSVECFYRLLLYKKTKIIHNLYPEADVSIWKRPSNFNFIRHVSNLQVDYANCLKYININYRDKTQVVYSINITKDYHSKKEVITITDSIKQVIVYKVEYPLISEFNFSTFEVIMYDEADLEIFEQEILNYHNLIL